MIFFILTDRETQLYDRITTKGIIYIGEVANMRIIIIFVSISVLLLLVGCQSTSSNSHFQPQGVIQMKQEIESEDLNKTLKELHDQGMKILDIKLWSSDKPVKNGRLLGNRIVYDIMYEEPLSK